MSKTATLQTTLKTLTVSELKSAKAEIETGKTRAQVFTEGLKLCTDPKKTGLADVVKAIFSGDAKLIPAEVQAILDAKRAKDCKDGEVVTPEGIVKQRWMTCLSEVKAGKTGPDRKDLWERFEAILEECEEKDAKRLETILADRGFILDK